MTGINAYALWPPQELTTLAAGWPVTLVSRETDSVHEYTRLRGLPPVTQLHFVCMACETRPSVLCVSPDASRPAYQLTGGQLLTGVSAHIRACHDDARVIPPAVPER